jgi:glycosyltransferase involved in cell wall biosynthesis
VRVTVITPNRDGARFLDGCVRSVLEQRGPDVDLEYLVFDAGSRDGSRAILQQHAAGIAQIVCEPDRGPADAINKGLARATGEAIGWLNADDLYCPGALARVAAAFAARPEAALCFGRCPIVDAGGREIRRGITRFKSFWFPFSCRFLIQVLNYVSQPALFFRRDAALSAGPLRTDLAAAWDYEFLLRLWRQGPAIVLPPPPLARFRWTPESISGRSYRAQFAEEYRAAAADAGAFSPQALLHAAVRWGIVTAYDRMARRRAGPAATP